MVLKVLADKSLDYKVHLTMILPFDFNVVETIKQEHSEMYESLRLLIQYAFKTKEYVNGQQPC